MTMIVICEGNKIIRDCDMADVFFEFGQFLKL